MNKRLREAIDKVEAAAQAIPADKLAHVTTRSSVVIYLPTPIMAKLNRGLVSAHEADPTIDRSDVVAAIVGVLFQADSAPALLQLVKEYRELTCGEVNGTMPLDIGPPSED